jgi:uncharacterized protein YecE (DUF72 family)
MLGVYARGFRTVEVDSTAYGIPSDPTVQHWYEQVGGDFAFALKLPQEVTHERRLRDTERVVRKFLDRVRALRQRLGPILVQLSPGFRPTRETRATLAQFLAELPTDVRWAVEFRHPGWMAPEITDLLSRHRAALALVDGRWIRRAMMPELAVEPTADFAYVRWIGADRRPADFSAPQLERSAELDFWADLVDKLRRRVHPVYGYVSNQYQGHAPHTVRELQTRLGLEAVEPDALREQGELF